MTDKTIPVPADLVRHIQKGKPLSSADHVVLAALLAEHDKAALPDCEVLLGVDAAGDSYPIWQRDGKVGDYRRPDGTLVGGYVPTDPERYSPLPVHRGQTITPEQHEQVAIAMLRAFWGLPSGDSWPDEASDANRDAWRDRFSDAVTALGLVVAS